MSTRQVLGAVGAAVGAYFGGAQGAQWGWAIGSAIGGAIDPEVIKGPSIGDIVEQTSTEGGPRPIVFALSKPMAGNIIAQGAPRIVKRKKSQGKGGPKVETESVYRTYAIGVCETIGGFVRVWRNGQLSYDISANSLMSDQDNAKFLETARFFTGSYTQNPSPDLEELFGVGTTPAHRGTAYMVMANEDLTDLRGAIPQWTFQVQRCAVQQPAILAISINGPASATQQRQVLRSTDGEHFDLIDTPSVPGHPEQGFSWSGLAHSTSLGITVATAIDNGGPMMLSEDGGATWELIDHGLGLIDGGFPAIAWSASIGLFAVIRSHATQAIATSPDGRTWTLRTTPSFLAGKDIIAVEDSGLFVAGQALGGTDEIMTSADGITWTARVTPAAHQVWSLAARGSRVFSADRSTSNIIQSLDGGLTWALRVIDAPFGLTDLAFSPSDSERAIFVSIFGVGIVPTGFGGMFEPLADSLTTHWEAACYSNTFSGVYIGTVQAAAAGIRIAKMPDAFSTLIAMDTPAGADDGAWQKLIAIDEGSAGGSACTLPVADIVQEICERAGLPASLIDVSDLAGLECRGLTIVNAYPAFAACRSLSEVFFFDPADVDGKVRFKRRGANSVATITENDFLDDEQEVEQSRRPDPISIPRVLHLNYNDVAGGIAPDKQSSERAGDRRATGEVMLQTAVMLSANEAAQVVHINHKIMIEDQRGELKYELPDSFVHLVPSDNVIVQWEGRSVRARIAQAKTDDGSQEYIALHDRQSAYTSEVEGIPAAPQTPPPSSIVGPTLIQPLDIHILQDSDDAAGLLYYVAVSGVFEAWQGAQIDLSFDGGATYDDSATTRSGAIMGELLTVLADHPYAYPDEVHTTTVRIETPFAELEETTLAGLMSDDRNLCIIGDELCQFALADETAEGEWELSVLLRGRKGTAAVQHEVGERFVLLDRASLAAITANLEDIGRTFTFRATSYGASVETGTVVSMVFVGRSQIERAPAYVAARLDGSDAIVSWQGVGRLGAGFNVAHGARFSGYRVTFDDGVLEESIDTTSQELTHDVSAFSLPLAVRVAQVNDLTGAGPEIEVVLT